MPTMSGFVAELITFVGSLQAHPAATIAAIFGVVLSAGYILWTVQRIFHGPPDPAWAHLEDARAWPELVAMGVLVVSIMAVGIYPPILTDAIESGIAPIAAIVGGAS